MALNKRIILTVDGYNIKLSCELKFYQNDALNLVFEIVENTINVKNGVANREIVPINPLQAVLFFETPLGVDSVESGEIVDNAVVFHLTSEQTQHIGVSRMQIQLTDGDCCRLTLPPFEFEIQKGIYDK